MGRKITVLMLCILTTFAAKAQITGEIKDSVTGEAVAFANVGVLRLSDSAFVRGAATNEKGKFTIPSVKAGEYIFQVSCINYAPLSKQITVKGRTDLGTVSLKQSSEMLEAIEIVEKRPLFSMEGEKTMYNVEDDPSIQTGTTVDALQNAPGVSVDAEGNVSLQGVNCVEIWLNDEPSKIKSDGLKNFLENLPANALQRIEVITHPSAKYATKGDCGVINIVTNAKIKKNHFIGFGLRGNSQPMYSPHLSYVWANEKVSFSFYSSLTFNRTHSSSDGYSYGFIDNALGSKDTTYHEQTTTQNENSSIGGWFSLNFDYTIDSTSSFSAWAGISPSWNKHTTSGTLLRNDYPIAGIDGSLFSTSFYSSERADTSFRAWGNLNASYTKNFDKEGHRLYVALRGNYGPESSKEYYNRLYEPKSNLYDDLNKLYDNKSNDYRLSLNTRYTKPYSKEGEISAGLEMEIDNSFNHNKVWLFDSVQSSYSIRDTLRTYDKKDLSHTFEGYLSWQRRIKKFTLEVGARAYLENRDYLAENACSDKQNPFFYAENDMLFLTFRPSVHLSYRTKSMHNFSASYSFSTSKPSSSSLSTFRNYSEDSYSVGNPDLAPSYTHNLRFNWSKFFMSAGYVGVYGSARWSNNGISYVSSSEYDSYLRKYINYSMPYNLGSSASQNIMATMNLRFGAFVNFSLSGNLSHDKFTIRYTDGNIYEQENLSLNLYSRLWARFLKNYQVFLTAIVNSPRKTMFAKSDSYYTMDIGASADLFKKKVSLSITVEDPFNWNKSTSDVTNPYYIHHSNSVHDSRFISFGIKFRFGKIELERKEAPQSGGGN